MSAAIALLVLVTPDTVLSRVSLQSSCPVIRRSDPSLGKLVVYVARLEQFLELFGGGVLVQVSQYHLPSCA